MPKPSEKEPELSSSAAYKEESQTVPPAEKDVIASAKLDDRENGLTWTTVSGNSGAGDDILHQWQRQPARWAVWFGRLTLGVERPFTKLVGTPQLNPFYHTGTIAAFLTLIVGLTGFYIFLFYKYGFIESYLAVLRMDSQFIARTMRAAHRYASGALVVTTLLHAYRTLFMERFRGQRWLAWITGIVLTIIIWLAGVTGYWLVWDTRAQLITDGFVRFLAAVYALG